ncbi:hypothetical protein GCM10029978_092060 [Actinoallomurus acanthiterrae]
MHSSTRLLVAGAAVIGLGAGVASPAGAVGTAAKPKAHYRAWKTCKTHGRWAKGYIETVGKPKKGETTVVRWRYAISKAAGNHKNSTVEADIVLQYYNRVVHVSGVGLLHKKATENSKWQVGPQSGYPPIGFRKDDGNELAFRVAFYIDGQSSKYCQVYLRAKDLKKI